MKHGQCAFRRWSRSIISGSDFGLVLSADELVGLSARLQRAAGLLWPAGRTGAAGAGAGRAALARIPAFRVRKSLWRLVLEDGYQNRQRRTVERQEGRDQGQHLRGRRADDERLGIARRLRSRTRCHRGDADPRSRRHHRRQGGVRRPLLLGRQPHLCRGRDTKSAQSGPQRRRIVGWQRGAGRGRRGADGARRRPGRIDPHALKLVRRLWLEADLGPGADHGLDADQLFRRSLWPDVRIGRRRGAPADRHRRP